MKSPINIPGRRGHVSVSKHPANTALSQGFRIDEPEQRPVAPSPGEVVIAHTKRRRSESAGKLNRTAPTVYYEKPHQVPSRVERPSVPAVAVETIKSPGMPGFRHHVPQHIDDDEVYECKVHTPFTIGAHLVRPSHQEIYLKGSFLKTVKDLVSVAKIAPRTVPVRNDGPDPAVHSASHAGSGGSLPRP